MVIFATFENNPSTSADFVKRTQGERHLSFSKYRHVSNIRRTLVGNKIFDHSDVVGASPVGAAPTTSSFST